MTRPHFPPIEGDYRRAARLGYRIHVGRYLFLGRLGKLDSSKTGRRRKGHFFSKTLYLKNSSQYSSRYDDERPENPKRKRRENDDD